MTCSSPLKKPCRKVTKAFISPGTLKTWQQAKHLIINQAAMDLIGRTGKNDKPPYGSMQKVLDCYSTYKLSQSQVQKWVERIKSQSSCWSLFLPITNNSLPPPVDDIWICPEQIGGSTQYFLTGPSHGHPSSDSGDHSLERAKRGRPIDTTVEAK
jgi:hypothetical protein